MSHCKSLQCMVEMCHLENQSSSTHKDLTQWVFHNSQTLHQQQKGFLKLKGINTFQNDIQQK